jgi:hypothetical protein
MNDEDGEFINSTIEVAENFFDGLGFCLSQQPDLLSQWRGYADDGQGFSIGFSKPYLQELSMKKSVKNIEFNLCKVLYEPGEHETELRPTFDKIKTIVNSGGLKNTSKFSPNEKNATKEFLDRNWDFLVSTAFEILPKIYILKNRAFREEDEWRLISHLVRDFEPFKEKPEWIAADYRVAKDRLIPYREVELKDLNGEKRINEVYIGPKNITPVFEVERFLYLKGFKDVKVHRSSATYR